LNREQLLAIYKKQYPERWPELLKKNIDAGMKGPQPNF
jgi:hypothetical protein